MKSAIDIILELAKKDIKLYLDNGKLKVNFAQGKLEDSVLELLKEAKEELIEYLSNAKTESNSQIPKLELQKDYALSSSQMRLWILSQFEGGSAAYNIPLSIELNKDIKQEYFKKAILATIERHEILRTVFRVSETGKPRQSVKSFNDLNFTIDYKDFRFDENPEGAIKEYMASDNAMDFDLENGPLLRAALLQKSNDHCTFYFNMHHIISDGWSMDVLSKDVFAFYEAYLEEREPALRELNIHYKDYSAWQNAQMEGEEFDQHRRYWLDRLSGEIPVLDLPSSRPRPRSISHNGFSLTTYLSKNLTSDLKSFVGEQGGTMFMALLASWNVLFQRYTGNTDLVIGTPYAGRDHADLANQIGFYVNTLSLRTEVNPSQSFVALYTSIKEDTIASFKHNMYPFDKLVEDLGSVRNTSRNAIFDVMLTFQSTLDTITLSEEEIDLIREEGVCVSKFDLTITVQEIGGHLSVNIMFNTDVYETEMIKGMMTHYKIMLSSLLLNYEAEIGTSDCIAETEKTSILTGFNETTSVYPKEKTIAEIFEEQVQKTPEEIALIFEDKKLTYKELDEKSSQLANYLKENYPLQSEDLIVVKLERSELVVIAMLGVLKSGCAYVPIDPEYPAERIEFIQEDCNCAAIIDAVEFEKFESEIDQYEKQTLKINGHPGNLAYAMYTSGSTGFPKGVLIENQSVVRLVKETNYAEVNSGDRILGLSNFSFDGSTFDVFMPLLNGGTLVISPKDVFLDMAKFGELVESERINGFFITTVLFNSIVNSEVKTLKNLNFILFGGEQVSVSAVRKFRKNYPEVGLHHVYGPTENTTFSTWYKIKDVPENALTIPIGAGISNGTCYVLNEANKLQPIGVVGEICLSGDGLARGYLNRPELTAEKFVENPFQKGTGLYKTGDLGRWLPDGNIEYVSRKDDQVKVRGYRIELGEVEKQIKEKSGVLDTVVIAKVNADGVKELVAYLVSENNENIADLRSYLSAILPDYMIPSYFVQLNEMPLNSNGKVDKKKLPDPKEMGLTSGKEYLAPRNALETNIARIWTEILQRDTIGINDDFFELGGHSLKAIQLSNEYHKCFNVKLELKELFNNSTLISHSEIISSAEKTLYQQIEKIEIADSYKLSNAQLRLWILSQFEGGSIAYNIPASFELNDSIDIDLFKKAILATVERHEILRTIFEITDSGEPRQKIIENDRFNFNTDYLDFRNEEHKEEKASNYIETVSSIPFDLQKGPLLRASILQVEDNKFLFYYNMHHIISDGWSLNVLADDVFAFYDASIKDEQPPLPELSIQYKDYSAWQHAQEESESVKADKNYWGERLKGELSVIDLPASATRPKVQTYNGRRLSMYIDSDTTSDLKAFISNNGGSLFMSALASWNVLLYRYTGNTDILLGSPVAGRGHIQLENQIGFYVNTIVLRSEIDPQDNFEQFYAKVVDNTLSDFKYQMYPFDSLVSDLNLIRDTSRNSVFDIMLTVQNDHREEGNTVPTEPQFHVIFDDGPCASKFDMDITIQEVDSQLSLNVIFNTDVYEQDMIERLMRHYRETLSSLLIQPKQAINTIDYLSADEKNELLEEFNNTASAYQRDKTITDLFEDKVKANPDSVAVIFNGVEMSYAQVNEKANQLAHYLRDHHTLKSDDLIGIKLDRSENLVVSILGVLKSGAAYVPIDPAYPEERINYIITDSNCKLIIDETELEKFEACKPNYSSLNIERSNTSTDLAYVIYTSGSTGNPKGVMLEHRSVVNFFHGMNHAIPLNEEDNLLAITSVSFDISILELFWSLTNGITVTIKGIDQPFSEILPEDNYSEAFDFSLFYFSSQERSKENKYGFLKKSVMYADENEFSGVWLPERHFHEFGGIFPNPSVLGAGLSTITENIEIRSGSVVLPLHDPVRVAEEWSVVDNLSNGRVALSIASGWHADDFILQPKNYQDRHSIMFDQIEELKTLWKGGAIKRTNGLNEEIDVKIFPKPINSDLQIYITSGGNPETFISAGRIGANVLTHLLGQELKTLASNISLYKQALVENGYDVNKAKISLMIHTYVGTDIDEVKEKVKEPFKAYLKSSIGLIKNLARDLVLDINQEKDLSDLLDIAFERYWQSAALFGTVESCEEILSEIYASGVTELACLIDFGIDDQDVLNGLQHLSELKNKYKKTEVLSTSKPITTLQITPSYLELLTEDVKSKAFLKSLKTILVGGEKFPVSLLNKLRISTSADIYNMYGPTETTIWSTCQKTQPKADLNIGKPISNTGIYILDHAKLLCPIGVKGELHIGGDGLARGYFRNADLTTEKFVPNPFKPDERMYATGDIARWTANGEIEILGRNDSQIKIRGFRIELGEIESALRANNLINEAVVIVEEFETNKELVAYFTSDSEHKVSELRIYLQGILPNYMIPHHLIQLEKLPLTPNGKVDKKSLPSIASLGLSGGREYVAPGNEREKSIAEIWKEILRKEQVGVTDSFFELGGDSLKAINLINEYHKRFNVKLELKEIFANRTLESHSALIQKADTKEYLKITKVAESESYALSDAQRRIWVLSQFEGGSESYNMPSSIVLNKNIGIESFKKAVLATIDRHEALRTIFRVDELGEPRQLILTRSQLKFDIEYIDFRNEENKQELISRYVQDDSHRRFDFETGPMIRASLLREEDDKYVFYSNMHHIISDGWSEGVLSKDVLAYYESFENNESPTLNELNIQYKDYAAWQLMQLKSDKFKTHRNYWENVLTGPLPVLNLPNQKVRPQVQTHKGMSLSTYIDPVLTGQLKEFVHAQGGTLFMGLLASWNVLFYRYTGEQDIILGSPIAGREHADLANQIGFYVNTLTFRTLVDPLENFKLIYGRLKESTLLAYEHQMYPFDRLVDEIELSRDTSRSAVFDVMLTLQNIEKNTSDVQLPQSEFDNIKNLGNCMSKFDVDITFQEVDSHLTFNIIFNPDIYDKETIERMMRHYKSMLSALLVQPEQKIKELEYLTSSEKHQLVELFNNTNVHHNEEITVVDFFEEQAQNLPDNTALEFEDVSITYQQLNEKANQLAAYLLKTYSVEPNDIIGVQLERSEFMIISMLGILKSGAAFLPIDTDYPEERINYLISDSQCKVIINEEELLKIKEAVSDYDVSNQVEKPGPDDLAYIIYTSGSTGLPKGVMVPHKALADYVQTVIEFFGLSINERIIQQSSISFDVSIEEIFPTLCVGAQLFVVRDGARDIETLLDLIEAKEITFLSTTPLVINELNSHPDRLKSIKTLISGGDELKGAHLSNLLDKTSIYNTYGPTEITVCATYNKVTSLKNAEYIGSPIANHQVYILDEGAQLLPIGAIGEMHIAGKGIANGYLNKPDLTREKFVPNSVTGTGMMYKSGDLGCWLQDGTIAFKGRKDNQVKIRGYRIELGEIENALLLNESVSSAVVIARDDFDGHKTLLAYVVGENGLTTLNLRTYLKGILPEYMLPSYFIQLDEIPVTNNGKVDTRALPAPEETSMNSGVEYKAPRNDVESMLVDIWSEVLTLDRTRISVYDNFFEIGGNSLKILKVFRKIVEYGETKATIAILFQYPTIDKLTEYLQSGEKEEFLSEELLEESNELLYDSMKLLLDDNEE